MKHLLKSIDYEFDSVMTNDHKKKQRLITKAKRAQKRHEIDDRKKFRQFMKNHKSELWSSVIANSKKTLEEETNPLIISICNASINLANRELARI